MIEQGPMRALVGRLFPPASASANAALPMIPCCGNWHEGFVCTREANHAPPCVAHESAGSAADAWPIGALPLSLEVFRWACQDYDRENGRHPGNELEGKAVWMHLCALLGLPMKSWAVEIGEGGRDTIREGE